MLDNNEPINFQPIIEALQNAQKAETLGGQLAELELALVRSEMNPSPADFCEMLWALEALGNIDITLRRWNPIHSQLESFY